MTSSPRNHIFLASLLTIVMELALLPTASDHERLRASYHAPNPFLKLLENIKVILGPSSGLDSQHINPDDLVTLMEDYVSDPADWLQYAWSDPSRAYTRNLVDDGNGKMNLVISSYPHRNKRTC